MKKEIHMQILLMHIVGYEFVTYMELEDLTIVLHGGFTVNWDDDIPLVELTDLRCIEKNTDYLKVLDTNQIECICREIEETGNVLEWLSDKTAEESDYYYEQYRESLYDN